MTLIDASPEFITFISQSFSFMIGGLSAMAFVIASSNRG